MELFVWLFQVLGFLVALAGIGILMSGRIKAIKANILLGKPLDRTDNKETRFKNMLLTAFGQKKMFERPVVGILHFAVYAGFLIINIEVLEIIIDGLLGTHRIFYSVFSQSIYTFLINFFEFMALGVAVSCILFLVRRNILKIKRFWSAEMTEWPRTDANIILMIEIVLMFLLYTMNATDSILQTRTDNAYVLAHFGNQTGAFAISQYFVPLYSSFDTLNLLFIERFAWWLHILGIFGFAYYVTHSKHLHIFLAFPNTFFVNLKPRGQMVNMPEVTKEVQMMLGITTDQGTEAPAEIGRFGAKDVTDLNWKNLMDAYSCTECGRCTSVCPANNTGKKLSPRKVMMDTRDRLEEIGHLKAVNGKDYEDGRALYQDFISKEELMACTTCNACAEECPINIDPLSIILQMRRYVSMEESSTPASWNSMFQNVENNFAPWAMSHSDRFNWAKDINDK